MWNKYKWSYLCSIDQGNQIKYDTVANMGEGGYDEKTLPVLIPLLNFELCSLEDFIALIGK